MNDAFTHSAYTQMIIFQNDNSKPHLVFNHPSYKEQRILHALAHQCVPRLEYEYTLSANEARISRSIVQVDEPDLTDFDWNQYMLDHSESDRPIPKSAPETSDHVAISQSALSSECPNLADFDWGLLGSFKNHQDTSIRMPATLSDEELLDDSARYGSQFNALMSQAHEVSHTNQHQSDEIAPCQTGTEYANLYPETTGVLPASPRLQRKSSSQSRVGSRANSISSVHSTYHSSRIGKIFSRTSSAQSATSMYSCFDSRSVQSAATDTSAVSRRARRAMDTVAKAAMKAVKAVGACWKCKLLRKQVMNEFSITFPVTNPF